MSYTPTFASIDKKDKQLARLRQAEHGEFQELYNRLTRGEAVVLDNLRPHFVNRLLTWLEKLPKQNPNWNIVVGDGKLTISQVVKETE